MINSHAPLARRSAEQCRAALAEAVALKAEALPVATYRQRDQNQNEVKETIGKESVSSESTYFRDWEKSRLACDNGTESTAPGRRKEALAIAFQCI